MAKLDYLTTLEALKYIEEVSGEVVSLDAFRKQVERGRIASKQYMKGGNHLFTRKELNKWTKAKFGKYKF
tara:strand:- start:143 stop:352 length:210 start_codon:yes stop_codon:yes gene_type:complete